MKVADTLRMICSQLGAHSIEHALIGAFALQAYGYARATRDIDFVVRSRDKAGVINLLESLGFDTIHSSESYSNHIHPIDSLRVDFMYVDDTTGDRLLDASRQCSAFGDTAVTVAAVPHLVAMKLFSARNNPDRQLRDLADVKELLRVSAIDKETLRSLVERYGVSEWMEMLTNGDEA